MPETIYIGYFYADKRPSLSVFTLSSFVYSSDPKKGNRSDVKFGTSEIHPIIVVRVLKSKCFL